MSKELEEVSKSNNEFNEVKDPKKLCVHDLKQKLKTKQKKKFYKNLIIFSVIIILFGAISILVYQKL
ncbi:hypothetical protein OAP47_02625 [Candidatus Pelagibacter sp.]|jgi:hypothetical protein|nr:hypothetical protein [Candidatus Pelagibacter sp.]MDA7758450.1 hypothetical protein [Candidatus Pelagibacter sp.]MDB4613471.1 hypothetical protein [Candidatus Pelagibacter sp.]MDC0855103.1 hypothetical protein [Candidatus Pelagibacter sp.]